LIFILDVINKYFFVIFSRFTDNISGRSIWKGNISFGLVNIRIKLYTITDYKDEFSFNQLDKE